MHAIMTRILFFLSACALRYAFENSTSSDEGWKHPRGKIRPIRTPKKSFFAALGSFDGLILPPCDPYSYDFF